ncbi:MAG: plasmid replication protein, CyRepA1 family [Xenococcaceae cyanobacterium]
MDHLLEWKASCVDEELTRLNVLPLNGSCPSEYLLYSDAIPRRNDGRISEGFLQRYEHTTEGGWWCSGIDVLTGEEDTWGCFKPDIPRLSQNQGKAIKYEHPPKAPTSLFALKVPLHLWEKIANRYGISILPTDIDKERPDRGFWQWFIKHPAIPLCVTEGAKKAGALLSAGYAAVALPGINSGYRTPKDELGNRIGKSHLIPQLQKLASGSREIYIVFDRDSKPNTVKAVDAAIRKIGYLLQQAGCSVKVITWDNTLGKGVDDFIANYGRDSFDRAYDTASSFEVWKAKAGTRLTHTPQIEVNSRYLPDLAIATEAKLIGIKSPKGTGKTSLLESIVLRAKQSQQKILVIGHRVQLVQALCQRFGIKYITEIGVNSPCPPISPSPHLSPGYGLCIDSLHPNSQAQFNPEDWEDAIVIIDEVEQVLWHGLNSSTCKDNRVAILKSLKTLMQNVLGSQGQVYLADADLSDIAIDYLISLSGIDLKPYIIQNDWKPDRELAWQVYNYSDSTPKRLVKDLEKHLTEGGKPFVCLSAQKLTSQWGTRNLEAYFEQKFPQAKILRIDSESLADPHHPAYSCVNNLDRTLANYDLVLASPSIETGVSIELEDHFTSVWVIAQGIQGENSVRQTLGRVRANVPRHIWCAGYGFNKIGNGSTSIPSLLTSGHRLTQLNIRLLQQSDFESIDDIDTGFQAESLLCWAKMAVRFNAGMINYRESILSALREEGHQIIEALQSTKTKQEKPSKNKKEPSSLIEAITEVREQNYLAECEAIANASPLSNKEYQTLKKRLVKTNTQRHRLRKYELQQRYYLPVTPELVALDDDGWYQKIRLHYFLTVGRPYLVDRDAKVARKLINRGNGSLFLPDFNGSQLGAIVGTMEVIGIPILLENPQRELRNTDPDLQEIAAIASYHRSEIKTTMGIGIAKNYSPVTIIRRFLEKIDYGLKYIRCESENKGRKRIRVYQIAKPKDEREQVFKHWLKRDGDRPGSSLFWKDDRFKFEQYSNSEDTNYLQLRLNF